MSDLIGEVKQIFDEAVKKAGQRRRRIAGCAYCDAESQHGDDLAINN